MPSIKHDPALTAHLSKRLATLARDAALAVAHGEHEVDAARAMAIEAEHLRAISQAVPPVDLLLAQSQIYRVQAQCAPEGSGLSGFYSALADEFQALARVADTGAIIAPPTPSEQMYRALQQVCDHRHDRLDGLPDLLRTIQDAAGAYEAQRAHERKHGTPAVTHIRLPGHRPGPESGGARSTRHVTVASAHITPSPSAAKAIRPLPAIPHPSNRLTITTSVHQHSPAPAPRPSRREPSHPVGSRLPHQRAWHNLR